MKFELEDNIRRISIARNKKSPNACNQFVREELLEFLSRENYEGSERLSTVHYVKILKFPQSKKEAGLKDSSIEMKNEAKQASEMPDTCNSCQTWG